MLGYVAATGAVWYKDQNGECGKFACWRFPFALQVILVAPLCVGMWFVPTRHVDIALAIEVAHPAEEDNFFDLEGVAADLPSIFGEQAELIASAPPSAEKAKAKGALPAIAREGVLLEGVEQNDNSNTEEEEEEGKGENFIPIPTSAASKMVTPVKQRLATEGFGVGAHDNGSGDGSAPERAVTFGSFTSAQGSLAAENIDFGKRKVEGGDAATVALARPEVPRVSQTPSPGFGQAHHPRRKVGLVSAM